VPPPRALAALVDELAGELRRRFSELTNEPRPELDDAERAPKIFFDTFSKLSRLRLDHEQKALTARIASGQSDLAEKQRQLERRRLTGSSKAG
jgi:hypothetical protein